MSKDEARISHAADHVMSRTKDKASWGQSLSMGIWGSADLKWRKGWTAFHSVGRRCSDQGQIPELPERSDLASRLDGGSERPTSQANIR